MLNCKPEFVDIIAGHFTYTVFKLENVWKLLLEHTIWVQSVKRSGGGNKK